MGWTSNSCIQIFFQPQSKPNVNHHPSCNRVSTSTYPAVTVQVSWTMTIPGFLLGTNLSKYQQLHQRWSFPTPPKEQTKDMKVQLATNLSMSFTKSKFPKNLGPKEFSNSTWPFWENGFSSMVRRTFNLKPSSTSSMASFWETEEENRARFLWWCLHGCWMLLPKLAETVSLV